MAPQDLSYLRFSLEETVRFMRGQEVGELYSISLDPQIQTEEADQFIRMHGFLELSGEYAPSEPPPSEQADMYSYKYVQQVLERGDNECEFFHHFPIDITIPKSRIAKMEDVEIYIDSFDYEFPEKANLKLTVDLSIAGIMEEEAGTERTPVNEALEVPVEEPSRLKEEEVNQKEPEFSILKLDVDKSEILEEQGREADFLVEVKRQPDAPEEEEIPFFSLNEEREEQKKESISNENIEVVANESPNVAFNESPDLMESPSVSHINMPVHEMKEVMESSPSELAEAKESPSSSSESAEEEPKKKKKSFNLKKTETMSLADFFARKESEEAVTWKVCLVQREDTLQKIAERYELPVADLVRENRLETNQSIEEGQALYIPTSR